MATLRGELPKVEGIKTFKPKKTRPQGTVKSKDTTTTTTTTPRKNVSGGTRGQKNVNKPTTKATEPTTKATKPTTKATKPTTKSVKTRRVNKAPKTPGSRQAGRGRTYTRTTIG